MKVSIAVDNVQRDADNGESRGFRIASVVVKRRRV